MSILKLLLSPFSTLLYVQIEPQAITIRNTRTGGHLREIAEIAITYMHKQGSPRGHSVVAGVGSEAAAYLAQANTQVLRPFAHPRSLVSDFEPGEALLKYLIKKALGHSRIAVAPSIVLHPMGSPEGGFTAVELRALQEMALGAGARHVRLWTGRALTDAELTAGPAPLPGGQWH